MQSATAILESQTAPIALEAAHIALATETLFSTTVTTFNEAVVTFAEVPNLLNLAANRFIDAAGAITEASNRAFRFIGLSAPSRGSQSAGIPEFRDRVVRLQNDGLSL